MTFERTLYFYSFSASATFKCFHSACFFSSSYSPTLVSVRVLVSLCQLLLLLLFTLPASSSPATKKMAASCADGSVLNGDGLEVLDGFDNMQLITFLESSFRRSEFIRVARILKAREESSKSDAVKDLSEELSLREAAIAELRAKHSSLKKELEALSNKRTEMEERVKKGGVEFRAKIEEMEQKLLEEKDKYTTLKGRYERLELAKAEAIRCCAKYSKNCASMKSEYSALKTMEQNAEEKFEILRVEAKLREKAANDRIVELEIEVKELEYAKRMLQDEGYVWKSKYLLLEGWILEFLKEHPVLVECVREESKNDQKQNGNICRSKETAAKLLKSDAASDIKESFVPTSIKSEAFIDISRKDIYLVSGASSLEGTYNVAPRKSSEMKTSVVKYSDAAGSNKNCCKRKFQSAHTLEATRILERGDGNGKGRSRDAADNYDDGDDAIPISQLKMKSLAQGNKEQKCASEIFPIVCNPVLAPTTPCNRSSVSMGKHEREVSRSKDGTTGGSAIF